MITHCVDELFASIFHSFEDEIADVISSFEYLYSWKIDIFNTELLDQLSVYQNTKNYFMKVIDVAIDLKHAWNRKYTGLAGQRLNLIYAGSSRPRVICQAVC